MCELTVSGTGRGAGRHYYRGESPCDECLTAANNYKRSIRLPQNERRNQVWKLYRLRWPDFEGILERQGGVCAVCKGSLKGRPCVDHDPACDHPGKGVRSCAGCVRGILCQRCNLALPILDDSGWLARAVRYLGREDVAEILHESRLF